MEAYQLLTLINYESIHRKCWYTCIFLLLLQGNMFSNTITMNIIDKNAFKYLKKIKNLERPKKAHLKLGFIGFLSVFFWVLLDWVFNANPEKFVEL